MPLDECHKVAILVAEYNTLRTEVVAARASVAQAIGLSSAVLMGVVAFSFSTNFSGPNWVPWAIAAMAIIYVGLSCAWNEVNTRKFTTRLRLLETSINGRAGERLLVWETDSGWGSILAPERRQRPASTSNAD